MLKEKIELTTKGHPAFWEEGGGMTSTGFAYIITGPNGEKLTPIYIRKRGNLSNRQHALFPLINGMHLVVVDRDRDTYRSKILTYMDGDFLEIEVSADMTEALEVAKQKTRFYHCRVPLYYLGKEVNHEVKNLDLASKKSSNF